MLIRPKALEFNNTSNEPLISLKALNLKGYEAITLQNGWRPEHKTRELKILVSVARFRPWPLSFSGPYRRHGLQFIPNMLKRYFSII